MVFRNNNTSNKAHHYWPFVGGRSIRNWLFPHTNGQLNACYPCHGDVIKCQHFPRYCPFVQGIHLSPVNSPHKVQWRGALIFFFHLRLNIQLSKQSSGWWCETLSRPLWRHCNGKEGTIVRTWNALYLLISIDHGWTYLMESVHQTDASSFISVSLCFIHIMFN